MAPLASPTSAENVLPVPPRRPPPRLHLECRDLGHEGSQAFFQHCPRPDLLLHDAVAAVLRILYPKDDEATESAIPAIRCVILYLHAFEGVAYTCSSDLDPLHKELHLSLSYLAGVAQRSKATPEHITLEIRGVVTHEMVHVYQHNGRGSVPGGVIEGTADWVRDQAGVGAPHWQKTRPGDGESWDQGYEKTGFFLSWLSERVKRADLVPQLNRAMHQEDWKDGAVLKRLLGGLNVEHLFREYRESFSSDRSSPTERPPAPIPTHVASP